MLSISKDVLLQKMRDEAKESSLSSPLVNLQIGFKYA
jgi:hypothetical protein